MTNPEPNPTSTEAAASPSPVCEPAADEAAARVAELEAALRETRERQARAQADFENARKRLRREAAEAGDRAVARFAGPVLTEVDHIDRAIAAAEADPASLRQGVAMIRENLMAALKAAGIEPVAAEGVFDPAVHEVVAELERADLAKGAIIEVFRPGWKLRETLIRAAQVVVARPPRPPADATPTAETAAPNAS